MSRLQVCERAKRCELELTLPSPPFCFRSATALPPTTYSHIHLILPPSTYTPTLPANFLTQLSASLVPTGTLSFFVRPDESGVPSPSPLPASLVSALASVNLQVSPHYATQATFFLAPPPAPASNGGARLLKRKSTEKKTALWALSPADGDSADLVRPESLLTEEDKAAPVCVLPTGDKGVKRKVRSLVFLNSLRVLRVLGSVCLESLTVSRVILIFSGLL